MATARDAINLKVLRRYDPFISTIIDMSSYVTVYIFDTNTQSWGIEGTLFVFQRTAQPIFGICIMNRLGIENQFISLTNQIQFELTGDYVMYQMPGGEIEGLWIFEQNDRQRLAKLLSEMTVVSDQHAIQQSQMVTNVALEPQEFDIVAPGDQIQPMTGTGRETQDVLSKPVVGPRSSRTTMRFHSLNDIWRVIENIESFKSEQLDEDEFKNRLAKLIKDSRFCDTFFNSYCFSKQQ